MKGIVFSVAALLTMLAADARGMIVAKDVARPPAIISSASSSSSASSMKTLTTDPILAPSFIMPWFCLERCDNQPPSFFINQLNTLIDINNRYAEGKGNFKIDTVSFERFNLGNDGTLVTKPADLHFDLNAFIRYNATNSGIKHRIAMVSSFPHPPEILNWTRALTKDPKPFTTALIKELVDGDMDGVNMDLEPTTAATERDAIAYANFLDGLNKALSEAPIRPRVLTVAGANWSTFWNIPAIASALRAHDDTPVGYFTSMNTYTATESTFETQLAYDMASFGTNTARSGDFGLLSPGLETANSNPESAKHHFAVLAKNNICQIAIWSMPLVDFFVEELEAFGKRCFKTAA